MRSITVRHNFETAHRLPHLGGKCRSLHGHSWWAEVTVAAPALGLDYTVVEFAELKKHVRGFIDTRLDHGVMLGQADPLLPALRADGSKVFVFGQDWAEAEWPTVEAVAEMLAGIATGWISRDAPPGTHVARVRVSETHVNAAEWVAPVAPAAPLPAEVRASGEITAEQWNRVADRYTDRLRESA